MDNLTETSRFNIKIEAKYFEQPAIQTFFAKWCEINDSIVPQFVDRAEWSKKDFLRPNVEGGNTLFLPKDLQLWEMVDVIEEVDRDTYASNPDFATSKKEELRNLGEMFRNTGVYIAQRVDGIDQGKSIAKNLAQDFYSYGSALSLGERPKPANLTEIAEIELTTDRVDQVDRWLAGDKLYESRRAKAEKRILEDPERRDEILEEERQKGLAQFFRIAEAKPWEKVTPIKEAFLNKIENQIQKAVETPK